MNKHRPVPKGRLRRLAAAVSVTASMALLAGCALESDGGGDAAAAEDGLTTVRVGYLHTVAVDAHLWLGIEDGIFEKHGLKVKPVEFDTGITESTALASGDVDVAMMGAVLSNFPAQGTSKVILANDVEHDTAQLWASKQSGIDSVEDLAGRKVMTTEGTTAHVYLQNALKANGVDPNSVQIMNTEMPEAVSGFISGAAPAVVLWVPFDQTVRQKMPEATKVDSAKSYYPQAAILGGWAANNEFYASDRETLDKLAAAWMEINDTLVHDPEAIERVHETAYAEDQSLADTKRQFSFEKVFSNDRWAQMYRSGEVARWIGQTERTFVEVGGLDEYVPPQEFLDTEIFMNAYDDWKKEEGE
jgi:NitT/TauT family transport system substrate-binding protein